MKLKKDDNVITLTNEIQIAAYKHAGWEEVPEKPKDKDKDKEPNK